MRTEIICGFPGVGKSYAVRKMRDVGVRVRDSDSSLYDKRFFPGNYIRDIINNIGKYRYIFISSHKPVRDELKNQGVKFTVVIPSINSKTEYLNRYKDRGNDFNFISNLDKNFKSWVLDCSNEDDVVTLNPGEYLLDYLIRDNKGLIYLDCFSKLDKYCRLVHV